MNSVQEDQIIKAVAMFAEAFRSLADTARSAYEEGKRVSERLWPERPEKQREAKVSRVPTAEDRAKEDQGAADTRPISQWLSLDEELAEPRLGPREREWLREHPEEQVYAPGTKAGGKAG